MIKLLTTKLRKLGELRTQSANVTQDIAKYPQKIIIFNE